MLLFQKEVDAVPLAEMGFADELACVTYDEELALTFKTLHGCLAEFLYTVPVRQVFQGNKIWDGSVWLFKLTGHPKARFGYAWLHPNDAGDDLEITTALEIPPVDSAQTAVGAANKAHRTNKSHLIVTAHFPSDAKTKAAVRRQR